MIPIDKARVPIARNEAALALFTTNSNAIRCAKAESFMKTMKVETVCPMTFENFDDVIDYRPRFIEDVYKKSRLHSALGYLSRQQFEDQNISQTGKSAASYLSILRAHSIGVPWKLFDTSDMISSFDSTTTPQWHRTMPGEGASTASVQHTA